ncbi:hypothetical protein TIFTF001_048901 [Ficus carica]|uniref:Transposase MuDR plant domain-containing protein n=1 Tax=Ficus carica TaxID=3494 RepID=A0AA87YS50_FICCA|nr:hypothetical protein TIFTF001_048901 [Ficus carica]
MAAVCVFIKYNGHWEDGTLRYVGGKIKGILVPLTANYVGFTELVRSVIGIRYLDKIIVMRYAVEPRMPPMRIQCNSDVNFYIQLKKKDAHVLSKFPISIDSDESLQPVAINNLIIPSPGPPHIPYPTLGLDLHMEDGIEEQHELLNNDLGMDYDDCNAGELNVADAARDSNEKSIVPSIGAHSIIKTSRTGSVNVPSSDSFFGSAVVADFTPITIRINCIFDNKKLLQYHLHHDAMSKHYQFKVKRSNSTLLHVICIDNERCRWQLRATKMKSSELFVVKRYDDVHTCSIEIVQGHHHQAKSWMIGECVKAKYLDPTNTSYKPREIMRDMHDEFGVSFNYLRAWRGKKAALINLRGDDAASYKANIVYLDADFGICVQHLAAKLKTRYKDFKGPMKTYFDGASRAYLVSEHQRHMEFIRNRNPDMHRYFLQVDPKKQSRAYFNGRRYAIMTTNIAESLNNVDRKARLMPVGFLVEWLRELLQRWFVERREEILKITSKLAPKAEKLLRTNFSLGLTITHRLADQFEYAINNNAAQTWIVNMRERTYTCKHF